MTVRKASERQRRIQKQVAAADKGHPKEKPKKAIHAGAREQVLRSIVTA